MIEYLAWWFAGGFVGFVASVEVLRRRRALTWHVAVVYALAGFACLYGAKIQHRLRFMPVSEALLLTPSELSTPGFHIPLGLVYSFVVAMIACRAMRLPALQVADALAMNYAVMMPIGRIGCLLAGCCTGTTCPAWLARVCVTVPALEGTEAPTQIVHLLPAYFIALGVVLTAIHVLLFRRGAPPGTLIAVGMLLYPLGQLAIEQLRLTTGDRGAVMTSVLLATIAVDAVCIAGWWVRRTWRAPATEPIAALGRRWIEFADFWTRLSPR